jgi:hypothetical protein
MSTATVSQSLPAPTPAARPRPWLLAARILRMEIRHSAFVWCLPLLVVLFIYDPYRTAVSYPALWPLRSTVVLNKFWPDMVVFAAGFSAWAGSREGRRNTSDLLGTTARPAWARQLCSLAGTAFWAVAAFLIGSAVIYVRTSQQATWGGPPISPVVVGAVGLVMVCAVAFALGALFPGRFTAPIVAVGLMIVTLAAFRQAVSSTGGPIPILSPDGSVPENDYGLFYRATIGVPIVQVMVFGGVTLAAVGLLGLSARTGGTGWRGALSAVAAGGTRLRTAALSTFTVGVALLVVGVALAGTGTRSPAGGYEIPSIDSSIISKPIPYTPVCSSAGSFPAGGFQVCVHPAYRGYLPQVSSVLDAAVTELTGLPGAPTRAVEVSQAALPSALFEGNGNGLATNGVYQFTMENAIALQPDESMLRDGFQQDIVHAVIIGSAGKSAATQTDGGGTTGVEQNNGTLAQQAVVDGLLQALGSAPYPIIGVDNGPGAQQFHQQQAEVTTAAAKFAALPAATRHAWLVANLAALKAGTITLAQVP